MTKNKKILNELKGIKNGPYIQPYQIRAHSVENLMKNLNYKKIGQGAYAAAFINKNLNHVLKIFYNDPAYETYINLLKSIPQEYKKFMPKILGIRKYPPNPNIKFVKMPLYTEINSNNDAYSFALQIISFFKECPKDLIKIYNNIQKSNDINYIKSQLDNYKFFRKNTNYYFNNITNYFIDFIKFIMYLCINKPINIIFDLHIGNIMMNNNIPVIIDPWTIK